MKTRATKKKRPDLERLTIYTTREAKSLLAEECEQRYRDSAARTPYGSVVTELIVTHLGAKRPPQRANGRAAPARLDTA